VVDAGQLETEMCVLEAIVQLESIMGLLQRFKLLVTRNSIKEILVEVFIQKEGLRGMEAICRT
jgi:hypothetical protein